MSAPAAIKALTRSLAMKPALMLIDIQNDYFPGGKMKLERSPEASLQAAI